MCVYDNSYVDYNIMIGREYGCGINVNVSDEIKGTCGTPHLLNNNGAYMYIGAGNGYLTGYGDDNGDRIYHIPNIDDDFYVM